MKERKSELADIAIPTRYVEYLRNLLSESSLAERKSLIKSFIKKVKVTGDNIMLTYTMPLPPKGLITEEMPVLSTVHHGGACWLCTYGCGDGVLLGIRKADGKLP